MPPSPTLKHTEKFPVILFLTPKPQRQLRNAILVLFKAAEVSRIGYMESLCLWVENRWSEIKQGN